MRIPEKSTPMPMTILRALAILSALTLVSGAQGQVKSFPRTDPYTKSAPDKIEAAGYVSLGPFRFGDAQTTDQVDDVLGGIPMIWVETKHFKLGSGLPEYKVSSDKREKKRIAAEIALLTERLPDLKKKVKKLDPWLRLHLFALRLEVLYADFLEAFGIDEEEFPFVPPDPKKRRVGAYMGEGRYLGMPAKFTVLLFDKKSALGRYSQVYLGQSLQSSYRWYFPTVGSWLFLTAEELLEGGYDNDTALTCEVMGGVSQCLAQGFRGASVMLPFPVSEGIAHWFSRRVDPRYHFFAGLDDARVRFRDEENWAPSVRARVQHRVFTPIDEMLGWKDGDALEWADHLILWSRLDYLIAREDGAAGSFLRLLKEPPAKAKKALEPEQLAERARTSLREATGVDLAGFDQRWSEWVLEEYPKK
jgi:hypothetical protein